MPLFEVAIRDLLEGEGFPDSASQEPAYLVGMVEAEEDFVVTVLPESGPEPQNRFGEFPTFSIRVRHPSGLEANTVLRQIFMFLREYQGRPSGIPVARIRAAAGPVQLGRDDNGNQGRWIVQQTFNSIARIV